MIVYPAIDLIDGKCVRLFQGKFDATRTYDVPPLEVAKGYVDAGAQWIHIVDLDGARNPGSRQTILIEQLVGKSGLNVQSGGGIRTVEDMKTLFEIGIKRIVIGSMAVKSPDFVKFALEEFGSEAVCIAVDVAPASEQSENYNVAISGWQENSNIRLEDLLNEFKGTRLKHILCTDISCDGTMAGSNVSLYRKLKKTFPELEVQASGGVGGLQDVINLNDVGVGGVIIGKALYENKISLKEALEVSSC
ncbi:MAG TPA: 1-(5-phosphoribosyl)-5-[(5-phosphoribosylamino)methylideneamino]imidazole-4-carboxamide isomerase [Alphaproteobacteria bacterium]|nr:1-(5-phosphoribosyl)-5-[(5-phosphoribosylamino)methylideneamino]imidazole-4-carboxamide isomerase [Alphaproteobacteria bacterium]HNS44582.1 1-(5-phosphoribosyl)-5-[(5-phosphoribosylamino)methylideneamino]imidazole-4-carboxamide isomerase [Alphaproteobacteria bacterium]